MRGFSRKPCACTRSSVSGFSARSSTWRVPPVAFPFSSMPYIESSSRLDEVPFAERGAKLS